MYVRIALSCTAALGLQWNPLCSQYEGRVVDRPRDGVGSVRVSAYSQGVEHSSALASASQPQSTPDSLIDLGTLQDCIRYAMTHQPSMQQSLVDEDIAESTIQGKLADWFPQLNLSFNIQHNPQLPVSVVGGVPIKQGLASSSNIQFTASQTFFNRDVLLAAASAGDVRTFAKQKTVNTKIDVVVNVSKAYYATLVTKEQIELIDEAIVRLEQSAKDASTQYRGGVVDKTDYMRAQIALNNARADRKQAEELLKSAHRELEGTNGISSGCELERGL